MVMMFNSDDVARITGGSWFHLDEILKFHGIRVNVNLVVENDLCFTTTPEQWGENIPDSELRVRDFYQAGASAVVTASEELVNQVEKPILLVKDSRQALVDLAFYARDSLDIARVLVTGTEGKTGFKNQLFQLLSKQAVTHANLDSSNLDVPIMCSMASISSDSEVEIIEASIANPNAGSRRSEIVQPQICVITEVGYEHISTHGSFKNLISNKASIVSGLKDGGTCLLNSDSVNYDLIREAVYQNKYVDIKTFGSNKKDNARLINKYFDDKKLRWDVKAEIEGTELEYSVPLLGEHVPLSSLIPLLAIHTLGYDVAQAAQDYQFIGGYETMGTFSEIVCDAKTFRIFDHSHRASILSYTSAFEDLKRFSPDRGGKKIAVVGNMLNIGNRSKSAHENLAQLIEYSNVDKLYTVGKFARVIADKLSNKSILVKHADKYTEIEDIIISDIQDGDLIFVKGHHRVWLKKLAKKIYSLGKKNEIR